MPASPKGDDESSMSSQSTGYDESSPSGANEESGSPLSGAAMRRSGRFTVIDDEDNGASGGERASRG